MAICFSVVEAFAPEGVTVMLDAAEPSSPLGRKIRLLTFAVPVMLAIPEGAVPTFRIRSSASTVWSALLSTKTSHPVANWLFPAHAVPFVLGHTTTCLEDLMDSDLASCRSAVSARVALSRRQSLRVSTKLGMASVARTAISDKVTISSIKVKPLTARRGTG